ncbi:MAG: hypothetical protein WDN28_08630 [Chthoniobacter sp.]
MLPRPAHRRGHADRYTALALALRAANQAPAHSGAITEATLPMIRFGGNFPHRPMFVPRRLYGHQF